MKVTFKPNAELQNTIKNKSSFAVDAGTHKFHRIEIEEELIPAMHGDLQEERLHNYGYGDEFGGQVGTVIELEPQTARTTKGDIIEYAPQIAKLFYGRSMIHTSIDDHLNGDIDKGGKHSYRNRYGESGLIEHSKATPYWTDVVMQAPELRDEIIQEMANKFKDN